MTLIEWLIRLLNATRLVRLLPRDNKTRKFIEGQHGLIDRLDAIAGGERPVWVHCASLGEYGVARPLIEELRRRTGCRVLLTFFSSTGYEALTQGRVPSVADCVSYFPIDSRRGAEAFVRRVNPRAAVFVISELWPNMLRVLQSAGVPAYLVSAMVRADSPVLRWYGGRYRRWLRRFRHIMVLDEHSKELLQGIGIDHVTVTGDPLFDNAVAVSQQAYSNAVIERFCRMGRVMIAGSISDDNDIELVTHVANQNRGGRFLFVPHEIHEHALARLRHGLKGRSLLYSECTPETDLADVQVLIIDFVGALSRIYRFCSYAYVGGGFTPYLHSIIEATVYGLPVAFGPKIGRKQTPRQLMELGIGTVVTSAAELDAWYKSLRGNDEALQTIREKAEAYTQRNSGVTAHVADIIVADGLTAASQS